MGTHRELCKNGHLLSETRITQPNGWSGCGVCKRSKSNRWFKDNPDKRNHYAREWKRKNIYNITSVEVSSLLAAQDNKCGVCKEDFNKAPNVDHDHKTGQVRGLLCSRCNMAIGLLKDSPEILYRAIEYLM